ncbi:DNA/RNA nuclease SfsA [Spirulina sp. CS-785/01]|uniref:DNA/RNA nuclease SfsA n=1 Tax=Spirulina sp. CS-785/01 TaxID=3021716 RepID=UPI0023312ADB|nr:DNA/RNA nuclease SfsA [Spirulina sp. CS-785/01]MDB9313342.1 DNA/RNA nuclease SfsA [Spirulina sp. CS-785/01]
MSNSLIYQYPPLQAGILQKRYKRFFADIQLDSGETITAHCPNTGPMTGLYLPGNPVQVSSHDNPKRKLKYTWEMIQVNDTQPTWVGVNTGLPNRVIRHLLETHQLPELAHRYDRVQREVKYGQDQKSRVDFLLTSDNPEHPPIYVEVKSATLVEGRMALFPDTVTTRGQKHLKDLMAVQPDAKAVILYFINRGDCPTFAPGDRADATYGQLLRQAYHEGVEVLPYRFEITPNGIKFLGLAEFVVDNG